MKKSDAWVVLRLDGDAVGFKDYIAVKGVYDSESAAQSAIPSLSPESNYIVIRSRHYSEDNKSEIITNNHADKVQGLKIHSANGGQTSNHGLYEKLNVIRDFWNQLPTSNRREIIIPLLSQFTELAIAQVMNAAIIEDRSLWGDLKLPNGEIVEVKTILLDPERRKSPHLQFPAEANFDFLAIVIFDPDFNIETARMIPVDALKLYARPVSQRDRQMMNLRVIQPFLDYPGYKDINFANYSLSVA
ncbi:hypothetical protein [Sphaerospermopsis torques-reginae]|uniref:Uncharacterized protein n=1 Tax=Sphaerospermopsis torques-reginae ITEP-024 TaxID=984208 RepID=A0ABX8X0U4_9CYAN|nr:hypothetical protein [Sphaerospermopsis torques-reginae]QYX32325.1 hypothetical protein K2F26_02675 [Sphaerospermopsis torques-reginae ITEP-024]